MSKYKLPRKKKKALKKRGMKLIIPQELCGEFLAKFMEIFKEPYSATSHILDKFPLKEDQQDQQDYTWEIQKL